MIFYNVKQGEIKLNALLYWPYTPEFIQKWATDDQILLLCTYYNLNLLSFLGQTEKAKFSQVSVGRQKLLDLFYLAQDALDWQLVTNWKGKTEHNDIWDQVASGYWEQHLCRTCWVKHSELPCFIHSTPTAFHKHEILSLYNFEKENKFDQTKTLRFFFKVGTCNYKDELLNGFIKTQLLKAFPIQNIIPFFSETYEKITHYYIVFEEAESVNQWLSNTLITDNLTYNILNIAVNKIFPIDILNITDSEEGKNLLIINWQHFTLFSFL